MPPQTRNATTTSRDVAHAAHPSAPKARKRTDSAADSENPTKKKKKTITVEQKPKEGRGGKLANRQKGQKGQKGQKRRYAFFFSFFFFSLSIISLPTTTYRSTRGTEDAPAGPRSKARYYTCLQRVFFFKSSILLINYLSFFLSYPGLAEPLRTPRQGLLRPTLPRESSPPFLFDFTDHFKGGKGIGGQWSRCGAP